MTKHDSSARTLEQLVLDHKGDRSYDRLGKDCGNNPTGKRLQQITTMGIKNFPDPDTIRGLSRGLGVSITDVVLASARSLGLSVASDPTSGALVLADVAELPSSARQALTSVAREMVVLSRSATVPEQDAKVVIDRSRLEQVSDGLIAEEALKREAVRNAVMAAIAPPAHYFDESGMTVPEKAGDTTPQLDGPVSDWSEDGREDGKDADVHHLYELRGPEPPEDAAARDEGKPSAGQRRRDEQDEQGES